MAKSVPLSLAAAFFAAISVLIIWRYIGKKSYARHISELRRRTSDKLFARNLILADPEAVIAAVRDSREQASVTERYAFIQTAEQPKEEELLSAVRESGLRTRHYDSYTDTAGDIRLMIITVTPPAETDAASVSALHSPPIGFITAADIPRLRSEYGPSEEEIDEMIIKENPAKKRKPFEWRVMLDKNRAAKYFLLGAALYLISFMLRYGLYLRILSAIALSAAGRIVAGEIIKTHLQRER